MNERSCTNCKLYTAEHLNGKITRLGCKTDSGKVCPFWQPRTTPEEMAKEIMSIVGNVYVQDTDGVIDTVKIG